MIDSAVEKREMEHKHALIQQRVSPGLRAGMRGPKRGHSFLSDREK